MGLEEKEWKIGAVLIELCEWEDIEVEKGYMMADHHIPILLSTPLKYRA